MRVRVLGVWLVLVACRCAAAQPVPDGREQQYVHEQWTVEDDLPVNAISKIIQDGDGYLWLATFDGLVRFDGVRFTVFNTGNTPELPSSRIVDLIEARGSLWMRTEQGHLVRYQEGVFTDFEPELKEKAATSLYEDEGGVLWIGTNEGVARYEEGGLTPVAEGELEGHVMQLYLDRAGLRAERCRGGWGGRDDGAGGRRQC